MNRRILWISLALLAAAVLFYFENRPAYKSYFSDDDLDNLGWPTFTGNDTFDTGLITPRFNESNFRPVGFLYYRVMGRSFHLNFLPYVIGLQALHLLNVALLFLILRRLDLSLAAAMAGALFYLFDATVMEVYWKPMYVFDLACATFCLITLLLYLRGHWIVALVSFWLAYKSKEVAVMLPVGLLAYEWLAGRREWKRLIPFFVISLNFGLQALLSNSKMARSSVYALNLAPPLLWKTIVFYSSAIFVAPIAALSLIALPILFRDRRLYAGLIMAVALLAPLLMLTNRYAQAYWYVPLIGLSIAVGVIAARAPVWAIALFFVLWLPANYLMLRNTRRDILLHANEARSYVTGLQSYAQRMPQLKTVIFESTPPHMEPWGITGAIKQAFGHDVTAVWMNDPNYKEALERFPVGLFSYFPLTNTIKGRLRTSDQLASEIDFHDDAPAWQLGDGWYRDDGRPFRRIATKAELTLRRPAAAQSFEIRCPVGENPARPRVTLLEDGHSLGTRSVDDSVLHWNIAGRAAGDHRLTILSEPTQHYAGDPHDYGITLQWIGYLEH